MTLTTGLITYVSCGGGVCVCLRPAAGLWCWKAVMQVQGMSGWVRYVWNGYVWPAAGLWRWKAVGLAGELDVLAVSFTACTGVWWWWRVDAPHPSAECPQ